MVNNGITVPAHSGWTGEDPSKKLVHLRRTPDAGFRVESPNGFAYLAGKLNAISCANCYWDGANWQRYDTSQPAAILAVQTNGTLAFLTKAAGANPIAAWDTSDTLTHTLLDKLINWPKERLAYVAAVDLWNATAIAAATATDLIPNQNFTVNSTTSRLTFNVRLAALGVNGAVGGIEGQVRAVIDSGGTPITVPLSIFAANISSNIAIVGGDFERTGLAAGTHTIKVQVFALQAFTGYCRANTTGIYESAAIDIMEWTP